MRCTPVRGTPMRGTSWEAQWHTVRGPPREARPWGPKWGVEFLVDGTMTTLNEHYGRFMRDGKYHWWILEGSISDWLVIDCRYLRPWGTSSITTCGTTADTTTLLRLTVLQTRPLQSAILRLEVIEIGVRWIGILQPRPLDIPIWSSSPPM